MSAPERSSSVKLAVTGSLAETRLRASGLSGREIQMVLLAGRGMLVREIAELLQVSQGTVKTTLKRGREKLGVANVRGLTSILLRHNLLTSADLLDRAERGGSAECNLGMTDKHRRLE